MTFNILILSFFLYIQDNICEFILEIQKQHSNCPQPLINPIHLNLT